MTAERVLTLIKEKGIEFVDFKIMDLVGGWHHITSPVREIDEKTFTDGVPFDGSSLRGFRGIEESDMMMLPDPSSAFIDPFLAAPTLSVSANIYEPGLQPYNRDPRSVAQRAEAYLQSSGIGDRAYFGPEAEFFVFDEVRFQNDPHEAFFVIDSEEAHWGTSGSGCGASLGYRIRPKGGYSPVVPTDALADIRSEMVTLLGQCGVEPERHHHEVGAPGQCEIGFRFDTLVRTADNLMLFKYIVKNVARRHGKTATFMPKPIFGDNGNGMHVHQSIFKGDDPVFHGDGYAHLSDVALSYIAGILSHAPALVALTNASTNSYRRLVPGYEAPVNLAFAKGNRSAAVRIPLVGSSPRSLRIEFRTPDATGNPYFGFAAMLMAGLDGVRKQLDPTKLGFGPVDKDIYHLSEEERRSIRSVPGSFADALQALEDDHAFLLEGGVFSEDLIATWIDYKRTVEVAPEKLRPTPFEYGLYFDV